MVGKGSGMGAIAILALAIGAAGAGTAGAGDPAQWTEPARLDPGKHFLRSSPQVDLGDEGYAVAGWDRGFEPISPAERRKRGLPPALDRPQSIVAVRLPSEEAFSTPDRIAPGRTSNLRFGVAEDEGVAVLVWHRDGVGIQARTHSPETGFGPIQTIADDAKPYFNFDIARDGSAVLAWRQGGKLRLSFREPGGDFSEPELGPMKNAWVVSAAVNGGVALGIGRNRISASVREPGESDFSEEQVIPGISGIVSGPHIQLADDGTAAVLGDVEDHGKFAILASTRPPGGEFGDAESITANRNGSFPEMDSDASGRIIAVWTRYSRMGHAVSPKVSIHDGDWSEPEFVASPTASYSSLDVAPSGVSIVGVEGLSDLPYLDALASVSNDAIEFAGAEEIEMHSARNESIQHDVAVNDAGEAIAVWPSDPFDPTRVLVASRAGPN
jgi:hypothetical protein